MPWFLIVLAQLLGFAALNGRQMIKDADICDCCYSERLRPQMLSG
ncbi:TPA: hypothetical protein ACX6MF_001613 [Photobacterium damselae]